MLATSVLEDHAAISLDSAEFNEWPTDPRQVVRAAAKLGIQPLIPGGGDVLGGRLTGLSSSRVLIAVLAGVIASFIPAGVSALERTFVHPRLQSDFLHDFGYWNSFTVALPAIILLIGAYYSNLFRTLLLLWSGGTVTPTLERFNEFVRHANRVYGHWLTLCAPWLVGIAVTAFGIWTYILGPQDSWHSPLERPWGTVAGWISVPLIFALYYSVSFAVIRAIATYLCLKEFFRAPVNVEPLHPDRCGGLSPLGRLSMKMNATVMVFGVLVGVGVLSNVKLYHTSVYAPRNIAMILGYVVGSAVMFFLPLLAAHGCMRKAKDKTLQELNQEFEKTRRALWENLRGNDKPDKDLVDKIEIIQKLHRFAAGMPVLPFNTRIISSFAGSVLMPLVMFALERLIERVL